ACCSTRSVAWGWGSPRPPALNAGCEPPRIDEGDIAAGEVACIAGDDGEAARVRGGCDQTVDGLARRSSVESSPLVGGAVVQRQDPVRKPVWKLGEPLGES